MLDFSALKKALGSLHKALERSRNEPDDEEVRDAVIQRFEYSYELCWKMLKRRLEQEVANPSGVDALSFKELIREGAERGYVASPKHWFTYRELRNITSHTYDEDKARSVYQSAGEFYDDAISLFKALSKGD